MDPARALAALEARQESRIVPGLERIEALCDLLDHPERTVPSIHVAGTNGKTTTTRLAARILCAHGLSAGRYTSPHLASVTERMGVCDDDIGAEELAAAYEHLEPFLTEVDGRGEPVTYFETLTALAFLWFADKPVEAAALEVGMGGRWDATNVVDAPVAILCSIDLDHPELGSTVAEVAGEKAAIVKPGATAVVHDSGAEALAVIDARAKEVGATILLEGRDYRLGDRVLAVGGQSLTVSGTQEEYADLFLPLHGLHAARNAASSVVACEAFLGRALHIDALRSALAGATSPGRLETVRRHPMVVLDGAHNPDAARALAAGLGEAFIWERLHLVIGVLEGKDLEGIVDALASRSDVAYACRNSSPRAVPAEDVAAACDGAGVPATTHGSVGDALDAAERAATDDDLILVTGSLYTVADARPRYAHERS